MKSIKLYLFSGTLLALGALAVVAFWPAPQVDAFEGAECNPSTITGPFHTSASGTSYSDCPWAEQEAIQNLNMNCGGFPNLICESSVSSSCSNPYGPLPYRATASGSYYCGQVQQ